MLFLHKLLFILLGTSVVAFIHDNPLQELELDHTNQEPEPEPLRHPGLITELPTSLRWFYRWLTEMLTSISGTSGGQAPGRPPPFAKGTWNRLPSTDTYEDYRDDVIVLHDGRDPKLYTLTNKPGEMRPQVIPKSGQKSRVTVVTPQTRPRFEVIPKPVSTRRLVDLWRRMPAASVDIQRRRDRLKIEEGVGGIHYRIYEVNPVAQPPAVAAVA